MKAKAKDRTPKEKPPALGAVIDIGGADVSLKLAQAAKGGLKVLESAQMPIKLGRDTFSSGSISAPKVVALCEIINGFLRLCHDYGEVEVRVVATSAIREAVNRAHVLDRIWLKCGVKVIVMDAHEEKSLIYKHMLGRMSEEQREQALLAHIGSGSLGLCHINKDRIDFIQNIRLGSLRLNELFETIAQESDEFSVVVEEYLESVTSVFAGFIPRDTGHFISAGPMTDIIASLCEARLEGDSYIIEKATFDALYDKVRPKTAKQIVKAFNLEPEQAASLVPAMAIYDNLLGFSKAQQIVAPKILLSECLLSQMLMPESYEKLDRAFNKSALTSARVIASRFLVDEAHAERVRSYAVKIFDKLKHECGLSQRDKLILQCSALFHNVGNFVSFTDPFIHSYNITQALELVGMSSNEMGLVAATILCFGRRSLNWPEGLLVEEGVRVTKLAAILALAEALDEGHLKKFSKLEVSLTEEELFIKASAENSQLERWAFESASGFFTEVFGRTPVLKVREGSSL